MRRLFGLVFADRFEVKITFLFRSMPTFTLATLEIQINSHCTQAWEK
jgi:hypothetical protein